MKAGKLFKRLTMGLVDQRGVVLPLGLPLLIVEYLDTLFNIAGEVRAVEVASVIKDFRSKGHKDEHIMDGITKLIKSFTPNEAPYFRLSDNARSLEPTERYLKRFR